MQHDQKWAAHVAFVSNDKVKPVCFPYLCILSFFAMQVYVSGHYTCPFGATGSVHAWERVARALTTIARELLALPVFVYVDDYFALEWLLKCISDMTLYVMYFFVAIRPECMEHSMKCFARLVRAVLGHDAISEDKLCFGMNLTLLGVEVELTRHGYKCQPQLEKKLRYAIILYSSTL